MRSFVISLIGVAMLVGTFYAGGAYSPTQQQPAPTPLPPITMGTPFLDMLHPDVVPYVLPVQTWEVVAIVDPSPDQDFNEFFGCQPPLRGSACVLRARGIGSLIPDNPTSAQDWRPLVEIYFEPDQVDKALEIMQCESNGRPDAKNPRSTASGLFQHLHSMWPPRVAAAGWEDGSIWDPQINIAVAAWLVNEGGGWSHWNPSRHCWG